MKRRELIMAAVGAAAAAPAGWAADAWPSKPVSIIVPTGAGGGYDQVARLVSEVMPASLGQSVVVDNRVGAGSRLGTQAVATAAPDGYTLLLGGLSNMVFNVALYPNLGYNPSKDFVPVDLLARNPYILVGRSELPAQTLQELLPLIKANPDKYTIGTAGNGTGQHVLAVAFAKSIGVPLTLVPYKSAGAVYQDLLGGRVDLFVDAINTARPHIESKRARPFVITSSTRDARLPEVPTAIEAGLPMMRIDSWYGLFAPAKTPQVAIDKLRASLRVPFSDPVFLKRMISMGMDPMLTSPEQTNAFLKSEFDKWTAFIREQGITGE